MRRKPLAIFVFSAVTVSFLVCILYLLLQVSTVQAEPSTTVSLTPTDSSAGVAETFDVNVTITNVQNLYGVEVTLNWNSTVLEAADIDVRLGQTDGALYNPVYIVENTTEQGKYTISASSTNPAPSFNGTGIVITLTFRVIGMGNSVLALESQLYDHPSPDEVSQPIAHSTLDGSFHGIVPEFPDVILMLTAVILMSAVAIYFVKCKGSNSSYGTKKPVFFNVEQNLLVVSKTKKLAGKKNE